MLKGLGFTVLRTNKDLNLESRILFLVLWCHNSDLFMSQLKYLSYSCRGPSLLLQRGRAAVVPIPLSSHYDKATLLKLKMAARVYDFFPPHIFFFSFYFFRSISHCRLFWELSRQGLLSETVIANCMIKILRFINASFETHKTTWIKLNPSYI